MAAIALRKMRIFPCYLHRFHPESRYFPYSPFFNYLCVILNVVKDLRWILSHIRFFVVILFLLRMTVVCHSESEAWRILGTSHNQPLPVPLLLGERNHEVMGEVFIKSRPFQSDFLLLTRNVIKIGSFYCALLMSMIIT